MGNSAIGTDELTHLLFFRLCKIRGSVYIFSKVWKEFLQALERSGAEVPTIGGLCVSVVNIIQSLEKQERACAVPDILTE
jgi:hypothetical protein